MKHALSAGLMLIFSLFGPNSGYAQPMTTSTPTTKILAVGTINPGVDPAKVFAILPNEVRDAVDLYLNGKIDQWYSQQERRGVVFILNVTDPAAPPHELRTDSYWPAQSASSVAGHESKSLAWQSGGPCGSLEPGQKRRMSVTGHKRTSEPWQQISWAYLPVEGGVTKARSASLTRGIARRTRRRRKARPRRRPRRDHA
jgi:hypothetical protein